MRWILNLTLGQLLYGVLTLGCVTWATIYFWTLGEEPAQSQAEVHEPFQPPNPIPENQPKILKFTLTLSDPDDLMVGEGDRIAAGQTLADRQQERQRLMDQLNLLELSLQRIQSRTVVEPPKPLPVPNVQPLPEVSYRQEEAELQRVSRLIDLQQQKMNFMQALGESIPRQTEQHERLVLETLHQELTTAEANLKAAQEKRAYDEYQHSLNVARRQEEANQQALYYANQRQEYEAQIRDREYQLAELQEKMATVEQRLEELAIVTAPYAGVVRRIKWLGQTNNALQVEVTLAVL